MRRRQTTRRTSTTNDNEDIVNPIDEIWKKIESIEQEVNQRFEEIDHGLNCLKEKTRGNECHYDERFLKLCHAVDYLLERIDHDYDTLACREMILSLLGQRSARPFSGRTIRNRQLCRHMKRWCLFVALVLFIVACMSIYGLHRNWCYLLILVRARAIQNQCFLVAAAQVASQNRKRQSYGYSLVVDRWGRVLLYMNLYSPLVRTIDIDLRYIEQVREKMSFIQHRRHDLYTLMSPTTIIDVVVSPFRCVERFSQLNPE
ncbi:unnamed protein product [Rotaria sordida]|uniref:CN hydrolase domain-containing protein n=1 Tax=Rotaria sordida TaxID=392033 RepID=A0A813QA69_9BILA|nr:unnamed protein product [Rotaria sordida]CAF0779454.1 unnamed protein product [Rotaria sordida]